MAKIKISSIYRFVGAFVDQRVFVGGDVHKKTFSVALLRADRMIKDWSSPAKEVSLTQILSSLPVHIGAVCYEAGPPEASSVGIRVIVAAPSYRNQQDK